jgi:NitT/TauT family transport system substrate-binding protein
MKRNDIGNEAVELERLKMALEKNFVTAEVRANGFGAVDMARLTRSIDQVGIAFPFTAKPTAADIFTAEFLPPAAQRSAK